MKYVIADLLTGAEESNRLTRKRLVSKVHREQYALDQNIRHSEEILDQAASQFQVNYQEATSYRDKADAVSELDKKRSNRTVWPGTFKKEQARIDADKERLDLLTAGVKSELVLWLEAIRAGGETHVSSTAIKAAGLDEKTAASYLIATRRKEAI